MTTATHLLLHIVVPGAVAWAFFRDRWRPALLVMLLTMLVDLDHLLADPIFNPNRCSIGFHPLHSLPAIAGYGVLSVFQRTRLFGVGMLIHMSLDLTMC